MTHELIPADWPLDDIERSLGLTTEIPMPTDRRRLYWIVDEYACAVLGHDPSKLSSVQLTAAMRRYAGLIAKAAREVERSLSREEWCLLADLPNGCADLWDYSETALPHSLLIVAQLEDGQRLDGSGDKWFGAGLGDAGTKALVRKIIRWPETHSVAIAAAVRYFWSDPERDSDAEWWRLSERTAPAAGRV